MKEGLKDMEGRTRLNICLIRVLEGKNKRKKVTLIKIMSKNFPEMIKDKSIKIKNSIYQPQ